MKFSFSRNHAAVLITLFFVIFLGACYFFIYLPDNEKDLQQQRFRTLQNIDNNIHEKIRNSVALMSNLLKDSANTPYIEFLNAQSRDLFTISLPEYKKAKSAATTITDSGYTINVNNEKRQILLQLTRQNISGTDTPYYQKMAMRWSFKQFIESLLPQNVFDQYIIFSDNEVIYETFPSGISYFKDSLLDKKNGIITSGVRAVTISGTDYRLFSQPVSFSLNNKWVISGSLTNKRYQLERNQLPPSIIILLVTVLLIIIVVFPWVKLYQMGNKDRLTTTDGIASIAVSMLLMSLLFFTFFKYNVILRPDSNPGSKDTLASQITTSFQNEIRTVYQRLHSFEEAINSQDKFSQDIINLNKDNISFKDGSIIPELKNLREISKGLSINQVFWLNNTGDETFNWTSNGRNAPHGNYSKREYFKNIIQNNEYLLGKDTSRKFYLDQVISWVTGSFTSVLSIPSTITGQSVGAISVNLGSLHKPVLPLGYQFAIIDKTGKALYHSDSARNLNENLKEEFSENEDLIGCMEARTEGTFKTKYFSKEYNVKIKPVDQLPYFIVIFEDTSYKETRDMETYSFTFSMLLLFFGFLVLQLFVVFLVSSKRSFFKKQLYDTSWIGPKIYSHHEYNLAAFTNVTIIVLALCFFRLSTFLTYLFILMFSVTFTSIFLTSLFARRYKKTQQDDNYKFKISTLLWLFIFVFIIDVAAIRTLDWSNVGMLLIYEFMAFIIGWIFFSYGTGILTGIRRHTGTHLLLKWNYSRSFTFMALTRLILTSGLPIVFFYITSYDYEQNISIRYRQLQYANNLTGTLPDEQLNLIKSNDNFARGFYYDGAWIKDIATTNIDTANKKIYAPFRYSLEEDITAGMLGLFRINYTDNAINESKFFTTHETDTLFFFNPLLKDACKYDSATKTYRQTRIPGQYLTVTASRLNYRLPSIFSRLPWSGLLFWTLLFIGLATFYFIIYNIIIKLFCIGLPNLSAWAKLGDKIIGNENLNDLLFIIGLPGAGKLKLIKEKIKNGQIFHEKETLVYKEDDPSSSNVFIADLVNIPGYGDDRESDEKWKAFKARVLYHKNKLVIVNHFEYNIHDAVTNRIKLNFLQELMLDNKCKIIILSTVHPVAFLDSVTNQPVKPDEKAEHRQDLERWHLMLGHYGIIVYPLLEQTPEGGESFKPIYKKTYKEIYKETKYTLFLGKIREHTIDDIVEGLTKDRADTNADELALKLQVTAHYFYMYIWQSLTKEEKFLLYDLAEDNLVNSFDDYNLNMLLAKGVIIRPDGTLKLFNKGFRNFILTAIGNTEAMKIQNTIKDNGNWNRLKNPLLIVVLAILTFLLTSQQEAYSRLLSYVAALGAGVPAILKLFSIFDKTKAKE